MDGRHGRGRHGLAFILFVLGSTSCTPRTPVDRLPSVEETLAGAGKRLSRTHSIDDLTRIATRQERVLALLNDRERDVMARGLVRFQIDRPADVYVAAPRQSVPFWIEDQGFEPTPLTMADSETPWLVFRKTFGPGWVGLGVNGLDQTRRAHYAVFLRARDGGPIAVSRLDPLLWEAISCTPSVRLSRDQTTRSVELPTVLQEATLLRTSNDRRHEALLARGRVWKTHVAAGRLPDQVTVAFGADPARELTWSWRTLPEQTSSIVRLRKTGDRTTRTERGDSETITIREVLNDPVVRRHTVRVSGLEPATAYEYALGENADVWTTARTAPRASDDVALIAMGDPQCGLEGWGKLLAAAYRRRPDAAALLIAGDLVDRGNERTNWDHFFLRASGVFERLPMMPSVGNHEYLDKGPWLFRAFFALPENGPSGIASDLVYSFEVGDAFIAVLDSTLGDTDPSQSRRQAEWLDERLTRTERTWKLVMFHHPIYASHTYRENPAIREAWVPFFDRHHVDLVLQGHDHAYLRTYPMRANHRVDSPAEGTVYVVSVSGDKYCEQNPRDYTEVGFTNVSTYQTIDVLTRENRLVYKAFDLSGRERDGFVIEKPKGSRRVALGER